MHLLLTFSSHDALKTITQMCNVYITIKKIEPQIIDKNSRENVTLQGIEMPQTTALT